MHSAAFPDSLTYHEWFFLTVNGYNALLVSSKEVNFSEEWDPIMTRPSYSNLRHAEAYLHRC